MNDYTQIENLIENGEFDNAILNINHSLEFDPNDLFLLNLLTICYLATYDYTNAQNTINKIFSLDPSNEFAKVNLDYLNKKQKMANKLYLCIKSLSEINFKFSYLYEINLIKDANEIDNTDEDYIFFLAFLDLLAKDFREFEQIYDYLIKNNSKYSNFMNRIKQNIHLLNYDENIYPQKSLNNLTYVYNAVDLRYYHLYIYANDFYKNKNFDMALLTLKQALNLNIYNSVLSNLSNLRQMCYMP